MASRRRPRRARARVAISGTSASLELREQGADLAAAAAGLVVVEQHVVGAGEALEAVDVLAGELEVALEVRRERREVATRRGPGPTPPGRGTRPGPSRRRAGSAPGAAFSYRLRVTRTSEASSESGSASLRRRAAASRSLLGLAPRRTSRGRGARASRGTPRARRDPRGGIIVCWSQPSSSDAYRRSSTSARCSRSSAIGSLTLLSPVSKRFVWVSRSRSDGAWPVRPLQHVRGAETDEADGCVRHPRRGGRRLVPDAVPGHPLADTVVPRRPAQLRRRRLPHDGGQRTAVLRLADRPRARPRARRPARGDRGPRDPAVPVRRHHPDVARLPHPRGGVPDRGRRAGGDAR